MIGTWKRSLVKDRVVAEVWPLVKLRVKDCQAVEGALQPYARFLGRTLEVRWP